MSQLREIREKKHLTQEELSGMSGISVRTIQRIESGTIPKGHTLKALMKSLDTSEKELLGIADPIENPPIGQIKPSSEPVVNLSKIKLINLSSLLFVWLPPLNILLPLLLSFWLKERNALTRQIISVQLLWTILAPIVFLIGIFLKLGHKFTIWLILGIALSNVIVILVNAAEIDRRQMLRFRLKFNIL